MKEVGKLIWALPMMAALLAACGGGGADGGTPSRQASNEIAVGEPHPAALNIADFTAIARDADCAGARNRLFIIDGAQVFWDRAGQCADASYTYTLYGNKPSTVLCTQGDTIAGPRTTCQDETARKTFETIVAHRDEFDLGLGAGHKVEPVSFLPKEGVAIPFTTIADEQMSGVTTRQNVVVRDLDAFQKLWAQHASAWPASPPSPPKVDFTRQMVVAAFLGTVGGGCFDVSVDSVKAGAAKLVVDVIEHVPSRDSACTTIVTAPMQMVVVDRVDAEVEFAVHQGVGVGFQVIDTRADSQILDDRNVVAKDADSFARLWAEHAGPRAAVPAVDFTKFMVAGVFLGTQPNGCYATRVGTAEQVDGRIRIQRVDTVPADGVVCTQAIVAPAQLVVLERSDLPVDFTRQKQALK